MDPKGQCYKNSMELLAKIKRSFEYSGTDAEIRLFRESACLVHGDVTAPSGPEEGKRFDHAWVEASGFVLDGDPRQPAAKAVSEFQQEFNGVERKRYSLEEAEELALKFKKLGPWDLMETSDPGK